MYLCTPEGAHRAGCLWAAGPAAEKCVSSATQMFQVLITGHFNGFATAVAATLICRCVNVNARSVAVTKSFLFCPATSARALLFVFEAFHTSVTAANALASWRPGRRPTVDCAARLYMNVARAGSAALDPQICPWVKGREIFALSTDWAFGTAVDTRVPKVVVAVWAYNFARRDLVGKSRNIRIGIDDPRLQDLKCRINHLLP